MTPLSTNHDNQEEPVTLGWVWLLPVIILGLLIFWPLPAWLRGDQTAWHFSRSGGMVAYLLLTLSTIWGLLLSNKLLPKAIHPAITLAVHNYLSWTSVAFTAFHGLVLLGDSYYDFSLSTILLPFGAPYRPLWVGAGVATFYLLLLTSGSYYLRRWIGQKNWRRLHYLTFLAFVGATLHGWQAGTDSAQLAIMYGASTFTILGLTMYRLLAALNPEPRPATRR